MEYRKRISNNSLSRVSSPLYRTSNMMFDIDASNVDRNKRGPPSVSALLSSCRSLQKHGRSQRELIKCKSRRNREAEEESPLKFCFRCLALSRRGILSEDPLFRSHSDICIVGEQRSAEEVVFRTSVPCTQ